MRNAIRILAAALVCATLLTVVFVKAQDTPTPTTEVTAEATTLPTSEATTEVTAEATLETTSEATLEATSEATSAATNAPAATTATPVPTVAGGANVPSNLPGVCDSDLILNLYIAERFFGFDGVMTLVASNVSNPFPPVDVTTLDKGQFAPLFAAPMLTVPSTVMSESQMQTIASLMVMDDNALMQQISTMMPAGMDMSNTTVLNSAAVPGEDPTCANLRRELNRFFTIVAFQSAFAKMNFSTSMNGANEIPPADPDGTGTATITIDMMNTQLCYTLAVQNIVFPATAAHIHRGAVGVSGPPVVPLDILPDANGSATSCVKVDAALLQEIASNPAGFYVNIHNSEFPNGAVRGQVSG